MGRLLFVLLTVLVALGYYTVYSNHMRARTGALHTGCCANLKNISFALDDYRKHHNGRYPDSLSKLTPIYLQVIPQCPVSRKSAYGYAHSSNPEVYTVFCEGNLHSPSCNYNFPQYDSIEGFYSQ